MQDIYFLLRDRLQGRAPKNARRSPEWSRVRREFLNEHPECAVCGTTKNLEVHHILVYHLFPDLECDKQNLITLCDGKAKYGIKSCHLLYGHLGSWRRMNLHVREDALLWRNRLKGDVD